MKELEGKRPATIVRTRNYGTEILRGRTKAEVAKKAGHGVRRGDFGAVSEIVCIRGGGYAAKAVRARPMPEPLPMWVKICTRLGLALAAVGLAGAAVLYALSELISAIPWKLVGGIAVILLLAALVTSPGRKCCTVVVKVFH